MPRPKRTKIQSSRPQERAAPSAADDVSTESIRSGYTADSRTRIAAELTRSTDGPTYDSPRRTSWSRHGRQDDPEARRAQDAKDRALKHASKEVERALAAKEKALKRVIKGKQKAVKDAEQHREDFSPRRSPSAMYLSPEEQLSRMLPSRTSVTETSSNNSGSSSSIIPRQSDTGLSARVHVDYLAPHMFVNELGKDTRPQYAPPRLPLSSPRSARPRSPSMTRQQQTPTIGSVANFKQRPRQPSMLRMVQDRLATGNYTDRDSPSRSEDEAILFGLERSRSPDMESPNPYIRETRSSGSRKRTASSLEPDDYFNSRVPQKRGRTSERLSSPPLPSPNLTIRQGSVRTSRRQTQRQASDPPFIATSPLSTPPLSDIQQTQQPSAERRSKREKARHLTTKILQACLPRRHETRAARQYDTFDIHTSSVPPSDGTIDDRDGDVDELQGSVRRRRNATPPPAKGRKKPKKGALAATNKSKSKGRLPVGKGPAKVMRGKKSRTYGRGAEDKENEEHSEPETGNGDGHRTLDGAAAFWEGHNEELSEAKKKFAQVDEWELEFESCDVAGGSSSPWR